MCNQLFTFTYQKLSIDHILLIGLETTYENVQISVRQIYGVNVLHRFSVIGQSDELSPHFV